MKKVVVSFNAFERNPSKLTLESIIFLNLSYQYYLIIVIFLSFKTVSGVGQCITILFFSALIDKLHLLSLVFSMCAERGANIILGWCYLSDLIKFNNFMRSGRVSRIYRQKQNITKSLCTNGIII